MGGPAQPAQLQSDIGNLCDQTEFINKHTETYFLPSIRLILNVKFKEIN